MPYSARLALTFVAALALMLAAAGCDSPSSAGNGTELLNVSYDPTRELWKQINSLFVEEYKKQTGQEIPVPRLSHGGSSSQASSVIDGLEADVVTLALWTDTDAIRKAGLIAAGWEDRLPNKSLPYTSTIVFVVRRGNPQGIKDWADLVRDDVEVVTPNPKTSGNGKLSFLAAWGSVVLRGGDEKQALDFVTRLYKNTPVLDASARGATMTFADKKIGDVHLTWENEAHLEVKEAQGSLEIVYPPISIRAAPPWPWSTPMSSGREPGRWPRPTCSSSIPTRPKTPSPRTSTGRASQRSSPGTPTSFLS